MHTCVPRCPLIGPQPFESPLFEFIPDLKHVDTVSNREFLYLSENSNRIMASINKKDYLNMVSIVPCFGFEDGACVKQHSSSKHIP